MATLPKVLINHADSKSAGGVALRVRTQGRRMGIKLNAGMHCRLNLQEFARFRAAGPTQVATSLPRTGPINSSQRLSAPDVAAIQRERTGGGSGSSTEMNSSSPGTINPR